MNSGTAAAGSPVAHGHRDFEGALTADTLSALMRSTWTWDDRALRRDLAVVLVDLAASRGDLSEAIAATLRARGLAGAAGFVGTVLGPNLIADTGNPLRADFVGAATDPAMFDRQATAGLDAVRGHAANYLGTLAETIDYPDQSSWARLAAERGADGLGQAMRGYGHTLSRAPLLGNLGLAWQTLRALGADGSDLADRIERGETRATLAAAEQSGSWDPALVRTKARPETDGWLLSGTKLFVPDAAGADVVLTIARSVAGPSLFAVDATAPGVRISELDGIDPTRPLFRVEFDDTPAKLLGRDGRGGALMVRAIDLAMTALAGEQVGLIERAIRMLLSHRAHDSAARDRLAEAVLDHAAAVSLWKQAMTPDADVGTAAMAHVGCSAASVRVAGLAAQVSGSEEAAATLRRALSAGLLLGGPAMSHERLLDRLGV
jgi:alkylation response protein AidB-like acyl-CoA dehydrogenase